MTLVPAQCTNCGAALTLNPSEDAAVCPYCNTPFIVQKAINYFTQNNMINAEVVNIYAGQTDFVIRGGRLERYNGSSTEVVIPNNVIIIGADAFEGCVSIKKIVIPSSVEEIESRTLKETNTLGNKETASALCECKRLEIVEFLDGVRMVPKSAFSGLTNEISIIYPNTIIEIGRGAFSKRSKMTSIRIPDSVQIIRSFAFSCCSDLMEISLSDNIEVIEENAFACCYSLKDIVIPKNVKRIEKGTFSYCDKLKSVKFNDHLEVIEEGAFSNCESLEAIEIPNSMKTIGSFAFYCCTSLKTVKNLNSNIKQGEKIFNSYYQDQGLCEYCRGLGKISAFGKCKNCGRKVNSIKFLA